MEAARQKDKHKGKVKVSFTDLGNEIIFDIEDNGPGIPIIMEDIIFTDGYTTKSGENHGIGLAIVKNSIGLLSGQIYIDQSYLGEQDLQSFSRSIWRKGSVNMSKGRLKLLSWKMTKMQ